MGLIVALALLQAACNRPMPTQKIEPDHEWLSYDLVGVVRQVEPEGHRVTIRHEAIPGFMAAMTMPFVLDDEDLLAELHPGDEVAGKLAVETRYGEVRSYRLNSLIVTRPALARPPESIIHRLEPGEAVPDFRLTLQDGSQANLADFRGQWLAITFIYTRCPLPDFCPLMDRKFLELRKRLDQAPDLSMSVRLLSISFDPDYDTPETLERHARQIGATPPGWTFAVADHEELAKITPGMGLTYAPGDREIVHNLVTALIDPGGNLAQIYRGRDWQPSDLIRAVRKASSRIEQ
ncbi:MAG: SCO family protein [Isosphaeraceae bacterium]